MRRSNWKSKVLIIIAIIIGIIAGIIAANIVNRHDARLTGLAFFATLIIVAGLIIFFGVKILRIGE